jgi:hypothetical protein
LSAVSVRHDAQCERHDERRWFRELGQDLRDELLEGLALLMGVERRLVE